MVAFIWRILLGGLGVFYILLVCKGAWYGLEKPKDKHTIKRALKLSGVDHLAVISRNPQGKREVRVFTFGHVQSKI